jgi:hypothetical protein
MWEGANNIVEKNGNICKAKFSGGKERVLKEKGKET